MCKCSTFAWPVPPGWRLLLILLLLRILLVSGRRALAPHRPERTRGGHAHKKQKALLMNKPAASGYKVNAIAYAGMGK